jgi:hypothetical protein
MQITEAAPRVDNANLKLRFVQARSWRYRKVATVLRRLTNRRKRRSVFTAVDFEYEWARVPGCEMTEAGNPKRALPDSLF